MKQASLSTYHLGHTPVQIVLREGWGAEFYIEPEDGKIARIKLGADGSWKNMCEYIVHEAVEMWMVLHDKRYMPCNDNSRASDTYSFFFEHRDLSMMSGDVGALLSDVLPDLARAYKAWRKSKK